MGGTKAGSWFVWHGHAMDVAFLKRSLGTSTIQSDVEKQVYLVSIFINFILYG